MKQNIVYADLHAHTTASDGTLTPTQIVKRAGELGLEIIGITDHDTLNGIDEALAAGNRYNVGIVPGIEISCGLEGVNTSIHILGLFVDSDNEKLTKFLSSQKEARFNRAHKILSLLEKEGINIEEIKQEFNEKTEKVLGRPHIARYLVEKGYVKSFQEAFDKYLLRGCPAYVGKEKVSPELAISLIQGAGGLAVLAHPGLISNWEKVWAQIEHLPWDGIEVFYSEHSKEQVEMFFNIVNEKNILSTGGSDYHGDCGKSINSLGTAGLNEEQFKSLLPFISNRKK